MESGDERSMDCCGESSGDSICALLLRGDAVNVGEVAQIVHKPQQGQHHQNPFKILVDLLMYPENSFFIMPINKLPDSICWTIRVIVNEVQACNTNSAILSAESSAHVKEEIHVARNTVERECDPDICRNCWVSYGDDTTGEPHKTRSCYNMNIFDGPSKKVYRGRSKVAGWGAFTTETISKNEFIGEYTGELVLQEVALEKQGDHPCTSYIFDLDDKYVIDAQHEGGVLKYVNHASNPNCYSKFDKKNPLAQIIFVGGRRRIGFFATWNIEPYEELFIDYGPEFSPVWENINKVDHSPDGSKAAEPNSRQLRRRCATKLATEDAVPT
ncbi:hypothetical protein QQ045_000324 [Rhodiola kirilowii]